MINIKFTFSKFNSFEKELLSKKIISKLFSIVLFNKIKIHLILKNHQYK